MKTTRVWPRGVVRLVMGSGKRCLFDPAEALLLDFGRRASAWHSLRLAFVRDVCPP
jgi:hypothetical protein